MTFDEICDVQYLSKSMGSEHLHYIIFIYQYHSAIPFAEGSLTNTLQHNLTYSKYFTYEQRSKHIIHTFYI